MNHIALNDRAHAKVERRSVIQDEMNPFAIRVERGTGGPVG